jgi:hypothetical protein
MIPVISGKKLWLLAQWMTAPRLLIAATNTLVFAASTPIARMKT